MTGQVLNARGVVRQDSYDPIAMEEHPSIHLNTTVNFGNNGYLGTETHSLYSTPYIKWRYSNEIWSSGAKEVSRNPIYSCNASCWHMWNHSWHSYILAVRLVEIGPFQSWQIPLCVSEKSAANDTHQINLCAHFRYKQLFRPFPAPSSSVWLSFIRTKTSSERFHDYIYDDYSILAGYTHLERVSWPWGSRHWRTYYQLIKMENFPVEWKAGVDTMAMDNGWRVSSDTKIRDTFIVRSSSI